MSSLHSNAAYRIASLCLLAFSGCRADAPDLGVDAGADQSEGDAAGEELAFCPASPRSLGLEFFGDGGHVTMGRAPSLGLEQFTLEAWVLRMGPGQEVGTGIGGVKISPLISKGRGEADGSQVDCNYAFGFSGEVLAADFEDSEDGTNHPVLGKAAIPLGTWHHVAASFDGADWRLYVDGQLDAQQQVGNRRPRADSVQHFGLGSALNSRGEASGSFHGRMDEVRVWSRARSQAEIQASMYQQPDDRTGLVSYWDFDDDDATSEDRAASNHGERVHVEVGDGVTMGAGRPPDFAHLSPLDDAHIESDEVELRVEVADPEGDVTETRFYMRKITSEDEFSIVVMPDTQYYTGTGAGLNQYFYDQTNWIATNRQALNIVGVIQNGDIVDNAARPNQWNVATSAMATLETPRDGIPDGLPYGVAVGNHDQAPLGTPGSTSAYNTYFGRDRFGARDYYGGSFDSSNDNSWFHFRVGGLEVVVLNLEYDAQQNPAVLTWARSILATYPSAFGIVNSHYLMNRNGSFGSQGTKVYEALKHASNLQLMTCGHITAEIVRSDAFEGHTIHSMLADYQALEDGGSGWMRLWTFSPARSELHVQTLSPTKKEWQTDDDSDFVLPIDLRGVGGEFGLAGRAVVADGQAGSLTEVEPGATYEWYAEIDDCGHKVRTPVRRFTTAP